MNTDPFEKFTRKEVLLNFVYRDIDAIIYYTWHMGMMDQEYNLTHLEILGSDVFNTGKAKEGELRRLMDVAKMAIDAHLDKKMPIGIALIWANNLKITSQCGYLVKGEEVANKLREILNGYYENKRH